MNDFTKSYEANVDQNYSELGKEKEKDPDTWGNVEYGGEILNIYTNPRVIHDLFTIIAETCVPDKDDMFIGADLGGAEGTVANVVQGQLRENGYSNAHVINYELLEKNLALMESKFPELLGVQADLKDLPLNGSTIDFAILRYVLPYLDKEGQKQVIRNAYSALKERGRLVILQDGGFKKEDGELYNQFFAESSSAQSGISLDQVSHNRQFISAEEICEIAEEAGFEVEQANDLSPIFKGCLSPEAYASRFNMTEQQMHSLQAVYKRWKESGRLEFSDNPNNPVNIRVKRPTIYLVLRKLSPRDAMNNPS